MYVVEACKATESVSLHVHIVATDTFYTKIQKYINFLEKIVSYCIEYMATVLRVHVRVTEVYK